MYRLVAVTFLSAASLAAQDPFDCWSNYYVFGTFTKMSSSHLARCKGAFAPSGRYVSMAGESSSTRHGLWAKAESRTIRNQGAPTTVNTTARWTFNDVVFSDGSTQAKSLNVRFACDVLAQHSGAGPGVNLVFQINGGSPDIRRIGSATAVQRVISRAFTVRTNVKYQVRIWVDAYAGMYGVAAPRGASQASVVPVATPCVLPTGFTVNSPTWGVRDNKHVVTKPELSPIVEVTHPAKAGQNATIRFSGGEPSRPMAYILGAPSNGTNIRLGAWCTIDLPLIVNVLFVNTDANGRHSLTFPLAASLKGTSGGIQAAQAARASGALYSSNSWRVDIE